MLNVMLTMVLKIPSITLSNKFIPIHVRVPRKMPYLFMDISRRGSKKGAKISGV